MSRFLRMRSLHIAMTGLLIGGCNLPIMNGMKTQDLVSLTQSTPISCQYQKSYVTNGKINQGNWYFLRQQNRTESRDEVARQGEIWQRDSGQHLFLTHVFFTEKAALDYTASDLKASGRLPSWDSAWSIIDPSMLEKELRLVDKATDNSGLVQETYRGKVNGINTEVQWLPGLKLPSSISHPDSSDKQSLRLVNCWPINKATIQPTTDSTLSAYRHIDYSDLGDMETDPLVQKIVALSGGHSHGASEEPHEIH